MLVKATGFLLKAGTTLLFCCTLVCPVLVGDRTPWTGKVLERCLLNLFNLDAGTAAGNCLNIVP